MKILYLGIKPAYPTVDGGCFASARLLHDLNKANISVNCIFLETAKHPFSLDAFPKKLKENFQIEAHFVNTQVRPLKALKGLFQSGSYNVERFYDESIAARISSVCEVYTFDAVIFDNVMAARYLHAIPAGIKRFVRTHNAEWMVWESLAKRVKNPLKHLYFNKLSRDLKTFETRTLNQVDGILSISKEDSELFQSEGIHTPSVQIPVSIPTSNEAHDYSKTDLFHVGAMDWRPNQEAVRKIETLLPQIRKQLPEIRFRVVGKKAALHIQDNPSLGIEVQGYVKNLKEFVAEQGILISPILSGSGVRIKLLEMMALGIPIVTTKAGAQGLFDTSVVRIAETDSEWIAAIYELASDENKRKILGQKGQSSITLHHNPETISKQILEFIQRP